MYKGKKVSLVLPAYNEDVCVKDVILNFSKLKVFDEIILVDNNSKDKTAGIARSTKKAKIVKEKKQGYGYALQKGLKIAKGDILVMCDCDKTYVSTDIKKLLKYSREYDLVFSTRTDEKYILRGSNMYGMRKYANILVGRLIQFLFNGPKMTDPGATFRLINRNAYEKIKNKFTVGGIHFQPEVTILALLNHLSIKEVPVYYGERAGISKISGPLIGGIKTAGKMLNIIFYYRLMAWFYPQKLNDEF